MLYLFLHFVITSFRTMTFISHVNMTPANTYITIVMCNRMREIMMDQTRISTRVPWFSSFPESLVRCPTYLAQYLAVPPPSVIFALEDYSRLFPWQELPVSSRDWSRHKCNWMGKIIMEQTRIQKYIAILIMS